LLATRHSQRNLDAELTDGVTNDPATALATVRAIKAFALAERTIVLPAHDPDAPARLAAREIHVPSVNNCGP
jgi:N-acyl homoserine lactone hydrolase